MNQTLHQTEMNQTHHRTEIDHHRTEIKMNQTHHQTEMNQTHHRTEIEHHRIEIGYLTGLRLDIVQVLSEIEYLLTYRDFIYFTILFIFYTTFYRRQTRARRVRKTPQGELEAKSAVRYCFLLFSIVFYSFLQFSIVFDCLISFWCEMPRAPGNAQNHWFS